MLETQYEKNLVINGRELNHRGIYMAEEIFRVINQCLQERGYTKREKKTEENVTSAGRQTFIELRPFKEKTAYCVLMQKIKIIFNTEKETVKQIGDFKKKFQEGQLQFIFDAWIMTDYENRWNMKPFVFFLKGMFHKFIYPLPLETSFRDELVSDTAYIFGRLRRLLQTYQEPKQALPSEEEVIKAAEIELQKEVASEEKEFSDLNP